MQVPDFPKYCFSRLGAASCSDTVPQTALSYNETREYSNFNGCARQPKPMLVKATRCCGTRVLTGARTSSYPCRVVMLRPR